MNEHAYAYLWERICGDPIGFFLIVCVPLMVLGWYLSDDPPCLCPEPDCPRHPWAKYPTKQNEY